MKNSKIFDIIKRSGQAICFNIGREQWLSDGIAAYSLAGLPEFSSDTLLCMLDKSENFPILMNTNVIIDFDEDKKEFEALISPITIKYRKCEYRLITFGVRKSFFIEERYIKDFLNGYGYRYMVRCAGKDCYWLAVYDGLIPVAAIMPAGIINTGFENLIDEVSKSVSERMTTSGFDTATGRVVPERNIIGKWQNINTTEAEQIELYV